MNTTLNNIRKHSPCEDLWKKLLASLNKTQPDDEALPMRFILDTLGVVDAIWALLSLEGADKEIILFACDCAERVLPIYEAQYPNDTRPREAIDVSRRYAIGDATKEELDAAMDAARVAWDAAMDAARAAARVSEMYAAMAAARVAYAASWAAEAVVSAAEGAAGAAGDSEREAQRQLFIKYFCQ